MPTTYVIKERKKERKKEKKKERKSIFQNQNYFRHPEYLKRPEAEQSIPYYLRSCPHDYHPTILKLKSLFSTVTPIFKKTRSTEEYEK